MPPNCSLVSALGPSVIIHFLVGNCRVSACTGCWRTVHPPVTSSNHHLRCLKPQGGSFLRRLKPFPARKVPVLAKDVVVAEARVHESVQLALGHRLPLFWVHVAKADVFHATASPPMWFMNGFSLYGRSGKAEIDMGPRKMCFPPGPSGFIISGAA